MHYSTYICNNHYVLYKYAKHALQYITSTMNMYAKHALQYITSTMNMDAKHALQYITSTLYTYDMVDQGLDTTL